MTPALVALLITRNTSIAGAVLFVPLSLVCWWAGVSGMLVSYSIALPCLVGITEFIKGTQSARISRQGSA